MERMDVHSASRPGETRVRHLDLDLDVRFDTKSLDASVTLYFDRTTSDELILDTRDLAIHSVENAAGFELGAAHPFLGAPLRIRLTPSATSQSGPPAHADRPGGPSRGANDWVRIHYSTAPGASG